MNRALSVFCGSILLTIPFSQLSAAQLFSIPTITVAPARVNSYESTKLLSQIAVATHVEVDKGGDPLSIIRERCGIVNKDYLALFQEANPNVAIDKPLESNTIVFPACFIVAPKKSILVEKGDSLTSIATKYFGSAGGKTLKTIVESNRENINCRFPISANSNDSSPDFFDSCTLHPGQQIVLLNVPITTNYLSKAETVEQLAQLKTELSSSVKNDSPASGLTGVVTPAEDLVASAESSLDPIDQCKGTDENDPYPTLELIKLLKENDKFRQASINSDVTVNNSPATVVVADTGLAGFDTPAFPKSVFRTTYPSNYDIGPSLNYGKNIYNSRLEPAEFKDYNRYGHGTHITGILKGGSLLSVEDANYLSGRFKILVAALLDIRKNGEPANSYSASTPAGGIINAAIYAAEEGANILNISFISSTQINGLADIVKKQKTLLVVASAGNTKKDADYINDVFPYSYGGANSDSLVPDQFIVVTAVQTDGTLAPFSTYGKKNIDLAASGCRIKSNSVSGDIIALSGTSESTPEVSLTGALLYSEGIKQARRIKTRVVSSLDRSHYLENYVAWGGKLNILKALSVYQDVLELSSSPGTFLSGEVVEDPTLEFQCQGATFTLANLTKVYRNRDVINDSLHALVKGSDGYIKQEATTCTSTKENLSFHVTGEMEPRTISWADVVDLVPRYFQQRPSLQTD
jgi:subtilisin family serine protease